MQIVCIAQILLQMKYALLMYFTEFVDGRHVYIAENKMLRSDNNPVARQFQKVQGLAEAIGITSTTRNRHTIAHLRLPATMSSPMEQSIKRDPALL